MCVSIIGPKKVQMLTIFRKMLSLVLVLSILQVNAIEISSYARVSKKSSLSVDEQRNDEPRNIKETITTNSNLPLRNR